MEIICKDNRFELIEKYKQKIIDATNIEDSQDEMKVLDNILFRMWQMGWLDRLEMTTRINVLGENTMMVEVSEEELERIDRVILGYRTWCKVFYQEEGDDNG